MQVVEHAETVKKLSKQEDLVSELQQAQAAHQTAVKLAHEAKVLLQGLLCVLVSSSLSSNALRHSCWFVPATSCPADSCVSRQKYNAYYLARI